MSNMPSQSSVLSRAGQYLQALGRTGQLLTLLGLLPAVADILAPIMGISLEVPAALSVLWFVCVFSFANFRVFEAQSSSDVEIQIKEHEASLEKWLGWARNRLVLNSEFVVTLHAQVNIYNHNQKPTHVKVSVIGVESEWLLAKKYADFGVRVDRTISHGMTKSDNPFILDAGDINDRVHIGAEIIFRVPDPDTGFGYLGSLSQLVITLGVEQASKKTIPLKFVCDVVKLHQAFENQLSMQAQNSRNNDDMPRQLIQILRQYWGVSIRQR